MIKPLHPENRGIGKTAYSLAFPHQEFPILMIPRNVSGSQWQNHEFCGIKVAKTISGRQNSEKRMNGEALGYGIIREAD